MSASVIELKLACFVPRVSRQFRVAAPGAEMDLTLTEASPLPRHQADLAEKFSLIFEGPLHPALPQRMHRLQPADAAPFDLFLVPVASRDPRVRQYQAVINREGAA